MLALAYIRTHSKGWGKRLRKSTEVSAAARVV
jgi:hypothetical protein